MRVYAVTSKFYSDTDFHGVWILPSDARAYCETINREQGGIVDLHWESYIPGWSSAYDGDTGVRYSVSEEEVH